MSKAIAPIEEVKRSMTAMTPQFKMALPPHVSPEKFVRTVLTAIQTTPSLMKAGRQSLYAAAMRAASAGLLPDGKEAALVPFKDEVQFMPMVSGVLKQIRNSGELSSITSQIIHEKDAFRYWVDSDGEHLTHEPNMFEDRGKPIGVYAMAKLKDGAVYIEVMTTAQIEDIRNVSRAKNGPAWSGPFWGEMAKKSSIRRLAKRLPISTDKAPALDSENDQFDFNQAKNVNVEEIRPQGKTQSRLQAALNLDVNPEEIPDIEVESQEAEPETDGHPPDVV